MSQNTSETFDEPDSMSDSQKESQQSAPDSSTSATSASQNSNLPHSSSDGNSISTSNNSSVSTSPNPCVLRKSFLNQMSESSAGGLSTKPNSTSDNVVSTTPKIQLKSSSLFGNNQLKPSALSSLKPGGAGGFALKAPTLKNPFARTGLENSSTADENKVSNQNSEEVSSSEQVSNSSSSSTHTASFSSMSNEANSLCSIPRLISPPKFVPLLSNSTSTSSSVSNSSAAVGGFVFGQNLRDRVTAVEEEKEKECESSAHSNTLEPAPSSSNSVATTNGTADMLFTSVLQKETPEPKMDSGGEDGGTARHKSLSEAAREYEESRAIKRKYDEVTPVTGEEEECNVLQINCKLFLYDKVKTWIELGRGQLRLNDINNSQSRIVIRVSGSLRVILNTKIWAEMVVQKASDNSIRLTAKESGQAKVYLVKTSSKETDQLYKALEWRVNNQKKIAAENGDATESKRVNVDPESSGVVTNGTSTSADLDSTSSEVVANAHSI